MTFRISPLEKTQFDRLFHLTTTELDEARGMRMTVTQKPGFPCRVSLADAEIGEEVILVHYEHQQADSPFRASHAVYVRPGVQEARLEPGEVPVMLRSRMLSLRGFDEAGMLVAADLADGRELEAALSGMFQDEQVSYIHLHFAKPGCYAARADRVLLEA